jgi:S-adenosylmethionine uptake transporter
MLLIVGGKPGSAGLGPEALIGAAAVLFSAIAYALNIIMLRHRATRDPLAQIILFQNAGPTLILLLSALWVCVTPAPTDLVQFAICGTLGVVAHTMLAHAFARIEAGRATGLLIFCRGA